MAIPAIASQISPDDCLDISLHKYQLQAYNSKKKIVACVAGIQSGKTTVGGLCLARAVAQFDNPGDNFLVTAPTAKIREQSSLPWLLKVMKGCGEYKIGDERFELNSGNNIFCRSLDDPNAIEGITNVKYIWADEAGMYKRRAWAAILGRSAFSQCPILISTTPYNLGWLYTDVYQQWRNGNPDIDVIQWRSIDNPFFPPSEIEIQRRLLDPRVFRMRYEGTFERMAGLVFSETPKQMERFVIDTANYDVYAGVDIGFSDPFTLNCVAVHKEGKWIISFAEYYKSQLPLNDRVNVMKQFIEKYKVKQFFVDSAHPTDIQFMQTAGLPVTPVKKGPDSVSAGIAMMTELIREDKWRIMAGTCKHLQEEMNQYSYPEDSGDGSPNDKPIDAYNHCIDGTRYVLLNVYMKYKTSMPKQPIVMTRLQRLIRGDFDKKKMDHNEDGLGEPISNIVRARGMSNVNIVEEDYWQ